jgi:y4mF family transcriptional regulator
VASVKNTADLGAIIRARRKEKKLTQKQLASLCGTSERFIVELEQGERAANVAKVLTVCNRLALDVAITARDAAT